MQDMSPTCGFSHHMISILLVPRKCAQHTKLPMCKKFYLSCFLIFSFMLKVPSGNVKEMCLKCHVSWLQEMCPNFMCPGSGNVPEILHYTAPGKVKEMSKFPGVGNVHATNKKCELFCTFHVISLPRKFRIFSSVLPF